MTNAGNEGKDDAPDWWRRVAEVAKTAAPFAIVVGFFVVAGFARALGLRPSELGFGIYEYVGIALTVVFLVAVIAVPSAVFAYAVWARATWRDKRLSRLGVAFFALSVGAVLVFDSGLHRWVTTWVVVAFGIITGAATRSAVEEVGSSIPAPAPPAVTELLDIPENETEWTAEHVERFADAIAPQLAGHMVRWQVMWAAAIFARTMYAIIAAPFAAGAAYFDGWRAAESVRDRGSTVVPIWLQWAIVPKRVAVSVPAGPAVMLDQMCLVRVAAGDTVVLAGGGAGVCSAGRRCRHGDDGMRHRRRPTTRSAGRRVTRHARGKAFRCADARSAHPPCGRAPVPPVPPPGPHGSSAAR